MLEFYVKFQALINMNMDGWHKRHIYQYGVNNCFLGLDKDHCLFCLQSEDNEEKFGRKIKKFGLTIHYFCMVRIQ